MTFLGQPVCAVVGMVTARGVYFHGNVRLVPAVDWPVEILARVGGREVSLGCVE